MSVWPKILTIAKHLSLWVGLTWLLLQPTWYWSLFSTEDGSLFWPLVYGMLFNAVLFYANALWAYPKFRARRWRYWAISASCIIVVSLLESMSDLFYADHIGYLDAYWQAADMPKALDGFKKPLVLVDLMISVLPINTIYWLASFAYLLPKERLRNVELERSMLHAELNQLRAQMEPHTLFNGINGIYHLIDEDKELAKQYLLDFSGILRYHLETGRKDKISIHREASFLDHYFRLAQLRAGDEAIIQWEFTELDEDLRIPPLLFYPLVENATKYLSRFESPSKNRLDAKLWAYDGRFGLRISNTYDKSTRESGSQVGLANLRERLNLLFPDAHQLTIRENDDIFEIELECRVRN